MTTNGVDGFDLRGSGAQPLKPQDPRRIGTVPLIGRLGAGGMGRVFLGVVGDRYAAVKQVLPNFAEDEEFLRHFGHELDNLSRLPAEATAPLLASDRAARPPWLATAYVPGLTLADALTLHGGPLPVQALWLLLGEAAAGLRAVHALDMVHRDLKPSNVMLTPDGVTLIDFGVAWAADQSRLTRTGMVVGTPAYMSPEQATARQLTTATDVFALGSLLAYAATGQPPFGEGSGVDQLFRIVHGEPDLTALRGLDRELAEVVEACLDKDPQARPTAGRLHQLVRDRGVSAASGWPERVMEVLAERSAFASRPIPRVPAADEPEAPPATVPDASARPEARPRRRRHVLVAVVPVVLVAGSTLAVQLLPQLLPSPPASAAPAASGSAPATAASTSASSPTAAGRTSASADAGPTVTTSPGGARTGAAAGGGAGGARGGSGAQGGSGSSGSGSSGTSSTGGGSTAGSGGSGYVRLRNAGSGACLQVNAYRNGLALGGCSGTAASWSFKPVSGGGFEVVNEQTGQCLQAGMFNNTSTISGCDGSGLESWTSASGSALSDGYDGKCLDLAFGGGVTTATCSAGSASQQWKRQ